MIWALLSWLMEYWLLVVWGIGVIVAFFVGGWRLALVVATLGVGSVAYNAGRKTERDNAQRRVEKITKERENAYTEIDARDTNRDDVARRLRDGSY
jgi:hypothetical protein